MRSPSISTPGKVAAVLPVAMMMFFASSTWSPTDDPARAVQAGGALVAGHAVLP